MSVIGIKEFEEKVLPTDLFLFWIGFILRHPELGLLKRPTDEHDINVRLIGNKLVWGSTDREALALNVSNCYKIFSHVACRLCLISLTLILRELSESSKFELSKLAVISCFILN